MNLQIVYYTNLIDDQTEIQLFEIVINLIRIIKHAIKDRMVDISNLSLCLKIKNNSKSKYQGKNVLVPKYGATIVELFHDAACESIRPDPVSVEIIIRFFEDNSEFEILDAFCEYSLDASIMFQHISTFVCKPNIESENLKVFLQLKQENYEFNGYDDTNSIETNVAECQASLINNIIPILASKVIANC